MSINASHLIQLSKRQQSLQQLSRIYSKIQYLELPEQDFSTEELHQLSLLTEYSIHPIFSSKEIYKFHLKLSQKYWARYQELKKFNRIQTLQNKECIIQSDVKQDLRNNQTSQIKVESISIQQNVQNISEQNCSLEVKPTETIVPQIKQVHVQLKVTKSYNDIKKFFLQFDYKKISQNSTINSKIQLLNAWTSVSCRMQNIIPKKIIQTPCKIDSATYLQNIKLGKTARKDSNNIESCKTIILGKNQSTQTKQMKHMLKVQAKTNFVEQKQKEESKLDQIQKKSIELNYLLNVITKQFFDDFYNDIQKIIKEKSEIIEIFFDKIIQKVKQEHNFIQIYVELIKKLSKTPIFNSSQEENLTKFNQLQQFFVAYLQQNFIKLISSQIQPSCTNFNEYKHQKQIIGMCRFIGSLIKQKILSKKIFKVCFWEIVYRYVEKVKENPQSDIVNECLIEGIVIISDSMGNIEMLKLMDKQKQIQNKQNDQSTEINKFEQMMMALVDPNDQDQISRQQSYKNLIESIKVEEYPHILIGLMQIFGSKRMKLQFLIEHWQQKLQVVKSSSIQNIYQIQKQSTNLKEKAQKANEIIDVQQDLLEIKKQIHDLIKQMKIQTQTIKSIKKQDNSELKRNENIIRKYFESQKIVDTNKKIFKLLVVEYFNEFADCKKYEIVQQRVRYLFKFMNSLRLKEDANELLLQTICKDQIENLMIIECDYHFLVDGLCLILRELMKRVQIDREQVESLIQQSYDNEDDDMNEFVQKIRIHLNKIEQVGRIQLRFEEQVLED